MQIGLELLQWGSWWHFFWLLLDPAQKKIKIKKTDDILSGSSDWSLLNLGFYSIMCPLPIQSIL